MNTQPSLILGSTNNTSLGQSIFLFLTISLPKESTMCCHDILLFLAAHVNIMHVEILTLIGKIIKNIIKHEEAILLKCILMEDMMVYDCKIIT
jgi:hypothetical protein